LISSSDRRVLDELHPESTQSARDRQPIHHWPTGGDLQGPQTSNLHVFPLPQLSRPRQAISSKSISGETHCRLAQPWPVRLALRLEAHAGQSTILSNVSRHPEHWIMCDAELQAGKPFNQGARSTGSREMHQEKSTTQWQKN
jgi:hypothetical protein